MTRLIDYIKSLAISQRIGAWRRGEIRISDAKRGRIYAKKDGTITVMESPPPRDPKITMTAKVIRDGKVIEAHTATNVRIED